MFGVFHFHIHVLQFTEEIYLIKLGIYLFVIYFTNKFTKYNKRRRLTMTLCALVCNNIFKMWKEALWSSWVIFWPDMYHVFSSEHRLFDNPIVYCLRFSLDVYCCTPISICCSKIFTVILNLACSLSLHSSSFRKVTRVNSL